VKISRIVALPFILVVFFAVAPAFPYLGDEPEEEQWIEYYRQWVEYKDGEISVAFDETPLQVALYHIHARTGLEIVVPSASKNKSLNLRLKRLSLEPAVRSLLSSIGFNSFALMYDETGRPNRAVVLEVRPQESAPNVPDSQLLTAEEKEKLQQQLERWGDLQAEERAHIEEQLKSLPPSEGREQLVREYGRQVLGLKN
jgi:hypothetical protein